MPIKKESISQITLPPDVKERTATAKKLDVNVILVAVKVPLYSPRLRDWLPHIK
jgi:hypothetical protein